VRGFARTPARRLARIIERPVLAGRNGWVGWFSADPQQPRIGPSQSTSKSPAGNRPVVEQQSPTATVKNRDVPAGKALGRAM